MPGSAAHGQDRVRPIACLLHEAAALAACWQRAESCRALQRSGLVYHGCGTLEQFMQALCPAGALMLCLHALILLSMILPLFHQNAC